MRTKLSFLFSLFLIINVSATSLWNQSNGKSLYTEDKAHQVGDILTVVISESANASQTAKKSTDKSFSNNFSAGTGFLSKLNPGTAGSTSQFSGNGSTVTAGSINATISVKVMEVLPNQNLIVQGKRNINVNNDVQEITLQGEVRPRDINRDNTIDSKLLADAKILYKGKGDIARSQKPSLFHRILGFIF